MEKLIIGSHVSFRKEKQLLGSVEETISYGANALMIYTGAPQNTNRLPINLELTKQAEQLMKEHKIEKKNVLVHAPYIINLANGDPFAVSFLKQEIRRCEQLGLNNIILHPGSHVKLTKEEGIKNIASGLNQILTESSKVNICLETMAGKGTEIGSSLDEIKMIIDQVKHQEKITICFDTCHINDAGYDITKIDQFLTKLDNLIGLEKLVCIHINDSKNQFGAHKDRHDNFGFGTLGFDNLIKVIYHSKLKDVPKILETPYVTKDQFTKERLYPPYKFEIEMIRKRQFDPNLIEKIRQYYNN